MSHVDGKLRWGARRLGRPALRRHGMTGLIQENVHLRSTDGGTTWEKVSSDVFG